MKIIRTTLAIFAFLVPVAVAQDGGIKTTLVTYAPGGLPEGLTAFFQNGGEILPFNANAGGLGDPIRYEGPRRFILRDSKESFDKSADQSKPPVAVVDLPDKCNNILILAVDAGNGKVRLIPYDVATDKLRPGEYKIFNFSHSMLSMIMGPQKFTIAPAEDKVIRDSGWNEIKAFSLKVATVKDGKAIPVNEMMWEHWPQKRQVIFMFDGRRKGEPIGMMSFNVEPPLRPQGAAQQ